MKFLTLALLFASLSSQASGMVTIRGLLTSNTATECALETKDRIYFISKKILNEDQLAQLKPGKKLIALTVPFSGIEKVQTK